MITEHEAAEFLEALENLDLSPAEIEEVILILPDELNELVQEARKINKHPSKYTYFCVVIPDKLGGEERFFRTENPADFEANLRQVIMEEMELFIEDISLRSDTIFDDPNWEEI